MLTKSPRISFEEYEMLPRDPGWKLELIDGRVLRTPRKHVIVLTAPVHTAPLSPSFDIRPLNPATDRRGLIAAFHQAFLGTVDFHGLSQIAVRADAQRRIERFCSETDASMLDVSRVALAPGRGTRPVLVGAALIACHASGPHLDMLFIRPPWQRRGIATALVQGSMNALATMGTPILSSFCAFANTASAAWHRRFGFVEEPDIHLARYRTAADRHELWRQEKLGQLCEGELAALRKRTEEAQETVLALEHRQTRDGYESVNPIMRYRPPTR